MLNAVVKIANKISAKFRWRTREQKTWSREAGIGTMTHGSQKICWASYLIISKIAFHFRSLGDAKQQRRLRWVLLIWEEQDAEHDMPKEGGRRRRRRERVMERNREGETVADCRNVARNILMLPLFLLYINTLQWHVCEFIYFYFLQRLSAMECGEGVGST